MGCMTVLKSKKKRLGQVIHGQSINKGNTTTTLLEPGTSGPYLQSAPSSFRSRSQPARITNIRYRSLSVPSNLDVVERDTNLLKEFDQVVKYKRHLNPLPLPLPSPQGTSVLKNNGSCESNGSNVMLISGPLPLPPMGEGLRNFSFEEISASCQYVLVDQCASEDISSTVCSVPFANDVTGSKKLVATVTRPFPRVQGLREFVNEVHVVASLHHRQLCKVLGFCAVDGSNQRMVVYERLFYGSLDGLLSGRSKLPLIDWHARVKVAICAAEGLAFLHEEGPFQAMYHEFSSSNIQVNKDFSTKLSGYGFVSYAMERDPSNTSAAVANLSMDTVERGLPTRKSNVWSFGIVLLELLTGRMNCDSSRPKENDIISWSRPFLSDDSRLSLIMDPRLKGRFPLKAARAIANIALKCLQKDPLQRPTMRAIAESLRNVQSMKYPCRFPLQDPSTIAGNIRLRSTSLNEVITPAPVLKYSPTQQIQPLATLPLPPQTCASTLSWTESRAEILRNLPSPMLPRPGVEGF